jgi:hypothetical protein
VNAALLDAPAFPLQVRCSLIPSWDQRRAVLQGLSAAYPAERTAVEIARDITYGRPDEDDEHAVRACCAWLLRRKLITSTRPKGIKDAPPAYGITALGLAMVMAPMHLFF